MYSYRHVILHLPAKFRSNRMIAGLYICQIFTGGLEFRLATSDYSGHGGCQIGTVEQLAKLDHVGLYRGVSGV